MHASYAPAVHESVALYFPADAALRVLQIDPRRLGFAVDVVDTPRGPMPHLPGPIPRAAVTARWSREALPPTLPDALDG